MKPGKGGAFVRTKLKKVAGGAVLERTFRADEKVPLAVIDKREMQYLYREGDALVFMDNETYDQLHVQSGDLGGTVELPQGGRHRHPAHVPVGVSSAWSCRPRSSSRSPRPSRACRATACRVPASRRRSRPGLVVQVPLFVEPGERIKVDTRTGEYLARA